MAGVVFSRRAFLSSFLVTQCWPQYGQSAVISLVGHAVDLTGRAVISDQHQTNHHHPGRQQAASRVVGHSDSKLATYQHVKEIQNNP